MGVVEDLFLFLFLGSVMVFVPSAVLMPIITGLHFLDLYLGSVILSWDGVPDDCESRGPDTGVAGLVLRTEIFFFFLAVDGVDLALSLLSGLGFAAWTV